MAGAGLITSFALVGTAFAQTQGLSVNVNTNVGVGLGMHGGFRGGPGPAMPSGIFGTVTAVNGNSLTVTSNNKMWPKDTSTTTTANVYTVDASNAKIYKNSTSTTSIANIATGDSVMVQGTIAGTNVSATVVNDGMGGMMRMGMNSDFGHGSPSTRPTSTVPVIHGNGEPVIAGNVSAVNGTTLTVTTKSNITYTVDAASTTIVKNGISTAFANIATGDSVVVQGGVNGTLVTASSIIDQAPKISGNSTSTAHVSEGFHIGGFFGGIGNFFKHLFGF